MALKESRKIIRSYNSIANALVLFEAMWVDGWGNTVLKWIEGLRATILIKAPEPHAAEVDSNKSSHRMYVNLDPAIIELVQEAKGLTRLGVLIPEEVKLLVEQEARFKAYKDALLHMLREIDRIKPMMNEVLQTVCTGIWEELDRRISPGLTSVMWTSLGIQEYIDDIMAFLGKTEDLLCNCDQIIENRIARGIREIESMLLSDIPTQGFPFDVEDFINYQELCMKERAAIMDRRNYDVEVPTSGLHHPLHNHN